MPMSQWYQHWCHYVDEPYGWEVEQYRHGQVCSTIANMSGKVLQDPAWPQDFYWGQVGRAEDDSLDASPPMDMEEMKRRSMGR